MHLYGLIIGIAFIIGFNYFSKHQKNLSEKQLNIFFGGIILFSLIGARVYHVIDQWSYYSQHLLLIPATWNGGLGIFGGIFGALIFIFLFSRLIQVSSFSLLDSISPIMPLCQAIGRIGNFVNHEINFWWIEASLDLILFFIIKFFPNKPTAKYLIGYGLIRFFFEFFRADTWVINQIKIGQIISVLFIILGFVLICSNYNKTKK